MWAKDQISSEDIGRLIRDSRDYALLNGLVLRYSEFINDNYAAHMPFTLFPTRLSQRHYNQMIDAQPIVNELTYKIARDGPFLETTFANVIKTDDFTKKLIELNRTIESEGQAQPLMSCLLRTDYMIQSGESSAATSAATAPAAPATTASAKQLLQVETNVIAAGMPALSPIVRSLHELMMTKYGVQLPAGGQLVQCEALNLIARGMIEAYDAYGKASNCYILLVREERSNNFSDHVLIEAEVLKQRPDIKFIRVPFARMHAIAKLGPNKELLIEDNKEVALVYFRYCYDPSNFDFPESWPTRRLIERSRAIKSPSIQFHLAGAKKFQQVLSPGGLDGQAKTKTLERFLNSSDANQLERLMCDFWPLDAGSLAGDRGFQLGLTEPDRWVLKPQREGGGHNLFGQDIRSHLSLLSETARHEERSQFILMQSIDSEIQQNRLLTRDDASDDDDGDLKLESMISEIGIFGSILADRNTIYSNEAGGYFTRSKRAGVNEGGISSGNAGISSLLIIS